LLFFALRKQATNDPLSELSPLACRRATAEEACKMTLFPYLRFDMYATKGS